MNRTPADRRAQILFAIEDFALARQMTDLLPPEWYVTRVIASWQLQETQKDQTAGASETSAPPAQPAWLGDFAPDLIAVEVGDCFRDVLAYLSRTQLSGLPGNPLPVLGLVRGDDPQRKAEALAAGCQDILVMPAPAEEVLARLSSLLAPYLLRRKVQLLVDRLEAWEIEQQRQQRLDSLGALAGSVAHDLNNLLTPIMVGTEMLCAGKWGGETERGVLASMHRAASVSIELVRQVLALVRGSDQPQALLDLGPLARKTMSLVRELIPRQVEIEYVCPADLWQVPGNAAQLHQAVLNLCLNARDALLRAGRLRMSLENWQEQQGRTCLHGALVPGCYVRLQVEDSGPGISRAVIEQMFMPFFTTKEPGKGTGLGLSTVLRLLRSHGGGVDIESSSEQGTRIVLYLPAVPRREARAAGPGETQQSVGEAPHGEGQLLLLIGEDESCREAVKSTLQLSGYRVRIARTPLEGVALCAQRPERIEAVVADLTSTGSAGVAAVEALGRLDPNLPVIATVGGNVPDRLGDSKVVRVRIDQPHTAQALLHAVWAALQRALNAAAKPPLE